MATKSSIEWTENTWNPVTGCTKISPGCKFCYAERMAYRLQAMGMESYRNGFKITLQEHALEFPLKWKKPTVIFVNSMSDLFHKDVPDEFILKVFSIMRQAHWHQFQVLTKRPDRVLAMNKILLWLPHIWLGTSVETEKYMSRIEYLRQTDAFIKFLSLEPLLGPLEKLNLENIDWAIVGGKSGPGARPMKEEWVINIRDQCKKAGVAFFFKQWGGVNKKKTGRKLEGRTWDDMPKIKVDA